MFVTSTVAGSCSYGYTWAEPGDVVEMPESHAAELAAIEPDRFTATVDDPRGEADAPKRRTRKTPVTETTEATE